MKKVVFADTNIFVSIFCFPKKKERLSLAHELLEAVTNNEVELLLTDVVAQEFEHVVTRNQHFLKYFTEMKMAFLKLEIIETPIIDVNLYSHIESICEDKNDVAILSSAISLRSVKEYQYLLTNDFENFHTEKVKAFLKNYELQAISMYGLLKILDRR